MQNKEIKYYSQNQEEKYILDFFKGRKGTLLSIGENDGITFSNAKRLIENGWKAILVEPSHSAFNMLAELHKDNKNVSLVNCAIGHMNYVTRFHESGPHLYDRSDNALLSTINEQEKSRWKNVEWIEYDVDVITYNELTYRTGVKSFNFITIDAEGVDTLILRQIDLSECELLCIEWNGKSEVAIEIFKHTHQFGMKNIVYQNSENLIISR